jgi:DNA-binding transcriptional LysR family regulator
VVKRADESVAKTRAFARGEFGELQVGYSPSPTVGILPRALSAFQKSKPGVKVILHDLAGDEIIGGLLDGSLHLAVMAERIGATALGLRFEELCRHPLMVAVAPDHPLARRRTVSIAEVAASMGRREGEPAKKVHPI